MKRKNPLSLAAGTFQRFPSIILFKSGIEELLENLQQEKPTLIKIEDLEYEYDSLDELFTKYQGKELKLLKIFAFYSEDYLENVMVTIGRSGIKFYCRETTPKTLAVQLRVKRFFKTHERQFTGYFFNPFFYFFIVALLILLIAVTLPVPIPQLSLIGAAILFSAFLLFVLNRVGSFSRILVIDRHEQETFLARNKDTIWVGVIVGIVTAVVTWFVTYLTTK